VTLTATDGAATSTSSKSVTCKQRNCS
jgi:hypothetical protein